ncbi:hypothetical protein RUM44_009272 [Polyplax serrata]|uniref:ATP-dependent RNA helicase DHX36 n=1 Tax=Polyplax serrata TaxID=468196 RepID=A0ABR1AS85_POLSC
MKKNKTNHYKKGVNCNKPLKAARERSLYESTVDKGIQRGPGQVRQDRRDKPDRPPPGLRGKAIGLWYRDQNRKQEEKPMNVFLDASKQEEIENVLFKVGNPKQSEEIQAKGSFRQTFLDKINVTFEEKLTQIESINLKPDPDLDEELFSEISKKKGHSKNYQKMLEFRQKLPSYKKRKEIIDLIEKNPIVVVSGETGCGKTTQVVQFVLDDYIVKKKGSMCNIVCTQPRRISAVSVAERVASERDEKLGESVGYVIRLENELPKRKRGSITYVTTGILIQQLQSDPALSGITHLFIDEIHERDTLCDFLITLLKYILPKRPDLRVILMSATLNADQFSRYFNGIPTIEIPGFTYPVEEYYLENILGMISFHFPEPKRSYSGRKQRSIDPIFNNYVLPYVNDLEKSQLCPKSVTSQLKNPESENLNINLIAEVIYHICKTEPEGAILVFVPGLSQIQDLNKQLTGNRFYSPSKFIIVPMHSILPTVNQKEAFRRPPPGVRKIVIATSIAETSITIDDVVYVVDSGRLKTKSFDMEKNVLTLEPEWETEANAKQRRGRAGRTQPGKCYKLFTKARQDTFEPYPIPEMQRTRLEEVILNAKTLQLGRVSPFLEKVMDPPDSKAVALSLKMLRTINALDSDERLTPLGFHLARLPMDPQTGKMILMGALFSCLDPILSIAACLNFKDPFIFVLGKEYKVHEKRYNFSLGEKSDHFMLSEAFRRWEEADDEGNGFSFAYENYLSNHNLHLLRNMKRQFAKHLKCMNFIVSDDPKHPKSNINSNNVSLVKAIVCSGLYPNVAMIKRIIKRKSDRGTARVLWKTIDHPKVDLHVKSLLEKATYFESPFVVYFEKMKSSSIYLHDATMVYPMALLFFGERLDIIEEDKGYSIRVDDMIKFTCFKKTGVLVQKLRKHLLWLLESAISNPGVVDWEKENQTTLVLKAIAKLITSEDRTALEEFIDVLLE